MACSRREKKRMEEKGVQTFVKDLRYISSGVAGASSYTAEAERLIVLFSVFATSFVVL